MEIIKVILMALILGLSVCALDYVLHHDEIEKMDLLENEKAL